MESVNKCVWPQMAGQDINQSIDQSINQSLCLGVDVFSHEMLTGDTKNSEKVTS